MAALQAGTLQAAVVAAAAAVAYYYYLSRDVREAPEFTVLAWNVLAREFTMFNRQLPGCVQGHHNPDDKLETREQTAARYSLASDSLIARAPDAVLLQELSADFFLTDVNPRAQALLAMFEVAHATNTAGPGTAVLLRRAGPLKSTGVVFSAGASEYLTGGTSKSASAVLVTVGGSGKRCWMISLHLAPFKFYPNQVRTHLELMGAALREAPSLHALPPPRVVIGGDLNAELHEVAMLQRECATLSGALARVVSPGDTGLSADFSKPECIDHLFISPGLRLVGPLELERPPASPYGVRDGDGTAASPVVAPSDHVWQSIRLAAD
jgi:hypothetical protein